jgi:hypothetical protein
MVTWQSFSSHNFSWKVEWGRWTIGFHYYSYKGKSLWNRGFEILIPVFSVLWSQLLQNIDDPAFVKEHLFEEDE